METIFNSDVAAEICHSLWLPTIWIFLLYPGWYKEILGVLEEAERTSHNRTQECQRPPFPSSFACGQRNSAHHKHASQRWNGEPFGPRELGGCESGRGWWLLSEHRGTQGKWHRLGLRVQTHFPTASVCVWFGLSFPTMYTKPGPSSRLMIYFFWLMSVKFCLSSMTPRGDVLVILKLPLSTKVIYSSFPPPLQDTEF